MAKQVKEYLEFIKFFKNLYADEIPLNFDEYFIITNIDGKTALHFPENKYCKITGTLDISSMPSFANWLQQKNSSVKIDTEELDELRKLKMADFISVDYSDPNKYVISTTNKDYIIERIDVVNYDFNFDFKYQADIPNEAMDNTTIVFYINNSGEISLTQDVGSSVLLDAAINKNFQIVFKEPSAEKVAKGAAQPKYTIFTTEKQNGFRIVMVQCSGSVCTMKQYFRTI